MITVSPASNFDFGADVRKLAAAFDTELLPIRDLLPVLRLSRATLYRRVQDGHFPAPIKIGNASRWSRRAVEAWLAEREANADLATRQAKAR